MGWVLNVVIAEEMASDSLEEELKLGGQAGQPLHHTHTQPPPPKDPQGLRSLSVCRVITVTPSSVTWLREAPVVMEMLGIGVFATLQWGTPIPWVRSLNRPFPNWHLYPIFFGWRNSRKCIFNVVLRLVVPPTISQGSSDLWGLFET